MKRYNYENAVRQDIENWIADNADLGEYKDRVQAYNGLIERIISNDSITGKPSESYTCNRFEAEENLCHNWHLVYEVMREYDGLCDSPEWCDVLVRCHLAPLCLDLILREYEENGAMGRQQPRL